jgi:hypothetical protein
MGRRLVQALVIERVEQINADQVVGKCLGDQPTRLRQERLEVEV